MGYVRVNKTFVYGDFFLGKKARSNPVLPGTQPFAIEILREFSTTEFVGKLFYRAGGSWLPMNRSMLYNTNWYSIYQRIVTSHSPSKLLFFEMEGSGVWQVQLLRDESDDSGPYIAVALKFGGPPA